MCIRDSVEVVAGEELLHDIGRAILGDAEVVDRRDVPVVQVSRELGLAEEAFLDFLFLALAGLDGDGPLDEGIPALVDGSKPAHADLLDDLVLPDLRQHGVKKSYHAAIIPACGVALGTSWSFSRSSALAAARPTRIPRQRRARGRRGIRVGRATRRLP